MRFAGCQVSILRCVYSEDIVHMIGSGQVPGAGKAPPGSSPWGLVRS